MMPVELICTRCNGAGVASWRARDLHPLQNVAGLWPLYRGGELHFEGRCRMCNGLGFTRPKSLPPRIPLGSDDLTKLRSA